MSDDLSMFIDMPADEYHSDPAVVGHSALVSLLHSPKHYYADLQRGRKVTPAMEFGTAFHTQVLEPERFAVEFVVKPKFDLRTTVGKENSAAWDAENPGKTIISEADKESIEGMFAALCERDDIALKIRNSYREKSFFWTDEDTGIECRIRPDLLIFDEITGDIIGAADLKSAQNASKAKFAREIGDRGYDLQAALYSDAISEALGRRIPFFLIPVEARTPMASPPMKLAPSRWRLGERSTGQLCSCCSGVVKTPAGQAISSVIRK